MVKFLIDLLQFLYSTLPLITCVTIFTLLSVWLSKSIKKHAKIYYIILAIPSLMFAIPFISRWFGLETFSFSRIPFLGGILRDYMHMATFGFPLLIVIMYTGALDMKITFVKKLMSIRKELSIISGFPVLCHSLVRVVNTFPGSFRYFFDHEDYMANRVVVSGFGAFLTNFSYFLGIFMIVLFLILWITSFDSVHKRLGGVKWKKVQKWSYVLYAMLFIHSLGIAVGGLLNPRGGGNSSRQAQIAEATDAQPGNSDQKIVSFDSLPERKKDNKGILEGQIRENNEVKSERGNRGNREAVQSPEGRNTQGRASGSERDNREKQGVTQPSERQESQVGGASQRGGRPQSIGFEDLKVNSTIKRYLHIVSLFLIFGSYLFLRIRKARKALDENCGI